MKKLLFGLLIFAQFAFAQTDNLLKVPGTRCSISPPAGFVAATAFSGFQDSKTGASIMINEIPTSYQSIVDGFTDEALKTRGMTLLSKQIINLNNTQATLINVSQPANNTIYIKQMLIFGDLKQTVLVNGIYPEVSKSIAEEIKKSLLSTRCNILSVDNPLDAAIFTIDVSNTELKLVRYMSGSLIYSADGKAPTEKPSLIVANSIARIPLQDQKKYAEGRLKMLPDGDNNVIKQINEVKIDDLNGFEIIADGKTKDNLPKLVYQVILFNDRGDYYIIVGQAKEEFNQNIQTFKKVSKTFKRK